MPNNISHQDTGSEIRGLHARLARLENSPQVGHQSILNGSLDILDSSGRVLMVLGLQPDGTIGVASYDPATGTKLVQMGQQAGGLYGLGVLNAASNQFQLVTGASSATARTSQNTSSLTDVSFSDDPVVTVVVGQSGSAQVTFGASIGTGGDGDTGYTDLTVDGAWLIPGGGGYYWGSVFVSCAGAGVGVAASVSRTRVLTGLTPGSHTFSLAYSCATGVHGISVSNRYVTVSAL